MGEGASTPLGHEEAGLRRVGPHLCHSLMSRNQRSKDLKFERRFEHYFDQICHTNVCLCWSPVLISVLMQQTEMLLSHLRMSVLE